MLCRHVDAGEEFDALRYACAVGRSQSMEAWLVSAIRDGSESAAIRRRVTIPNSKPIIPEHENNLCLNGEGLAGVERDALILAMEESGGIKAKAARRLQITRATFHSKWERLVKIPMVMLLAFVVSGCVCGDGFVSSQTTIIPQVIESSSANMPALPERTVTMSAALAPSTNGYSVNLAWDASPSAGVTSYSMYVSSNKLDWVNFGQTTGLTMTVQSATLPQWYAVTSRGDSGESEFSNIVGWIGVNSVITVTAESSEDLQSWQDFAQIFKGTNVPGMKFFRTRAESQHQRIIESDQ